MDDMMTPAVAAGVGRGRGAVRGGLFDTPEEAAASQQQQQQEESPSTPS
jgi:hypothetical protein